MQYFVAVGMAVIKYLIFSLFLKRVLASPSAKRIERGNSVLDLSIAIPVLMEARHTTRIRPVVDIVSLQGYR